MALPPTRIYRYISTPERTFAALKKDGLLRDDVDEARFIQTMRDVENHAPMPPGMVGPNVTDLTAQALWGFLNEAGTELAHTPMYYPGPQEDDGETQDTRASTSDEKFTAWDAAQALGGLMLAAAVPVALYLGLLAALGVRSHPEVHTIHYILGSALAVFSSFVIAIAGESLIEDVVKFVLLGGGAFAIWAGTTTPASAIILGIAVGSFMPLAARLLTRRGESPRR